MEIEDQDIVVVLSHEGRGALRDLGIDTQPAPVLLHAMEKDEHGVWILYQQEDGDHLVLVRWEHIQALDIARGQATPVGSLNVN